MIGRGTRLCSGKDNCLVIDFDYLTSKHDLVRPADLFGLDPKIGKAVAEDSAKDAEHDLLDQVAKAREKVERKARLEIEAEARKVRYRHRLDFDPLDYSKQVFGLDYQPPSDANAKMATPKQLECLAKMGIRTSSMSRDQASFLIGQWVQRVSKGLSTPKQISMLIRNGYEPSEVRSMTMAEASERIDRIIGGAHIAQG